jgi:hypothetical protein
MRHLAHAVSHFDDTVSRADGRATVNCVRCFGNGHTALASCDLGPRIRRGYASGMGRGRQLAGWTQRPASNGRITVKRVRYSRPLRILDLVSGGQAALCAYRSASDRSAAVFAAQGTTAPLLDSARLVKLITRLRSVSGERLNFNMSSGSIQVAARRPLHRESKAL